MPLYGFEPTAVAMKDFRTVYIGGHPGSYKTSLAFRIAWYLYEHNKSKRVISNAPCVWNEKLDKLEIEDPRDLSATIILDEGGQFLKSEAKAKPFLAFLRKFNSYLIVPSVASVSSSTITAVTIKCDLRLTRGGIPLLRYKTWVEKKAFSSFWWYKPSEIFGVYDTTAGVVEANKIGNYMLEMQQRLIAINPDNLESDDDETPPHRTPKDKSPKKYKPMVVENDPYEDLEDEELVD